jgi:hypothetical protein
MKKNKSESRDPTASKQDKNTPKNDLHLSNENLNPFDSN